MFQVGVLVDHVHLGSNVTSVHVLIEQVVLQDYPAAEAVGADQKDAAPEVDMVVALRQERSVDKSPESLFRVVLDHLRHGRSYTNHLILESDLGWLIAHRRWLVGWRQGAGGEGAGGWIKVGNRELKCKSIESNRKQSDAPIKNTRKVSKHTETRACLFADRS